MAVGSPNPDLAKDVQTLFSVGVVANLSDGQLLERFASGPDGDRAAEAAFTELVRRHGPMVLRVCRNILNDPHDAQDAVQATFLVLVRKAGSVRNRDSIAGWLHETALRVARRARADAARRRLRERSGAVSEVAEPDSSRQEGWPELHEELARLPEKYRAPLVLCYLEGMTTEVAAKQLGCPQGTILCRLSRGRERLRNRLIRRGLTASAALLAFERSPEVSGALTAGLVTSTVRAGLEYAAGGLAATAAGAVSARGLALAQDVLRTMFMTKIKLLGAVVLAGTAIAVVAPSTRMMRTQARAQQSSVARPGAKNLRGTDRRAEQPLPKTTILKYGDGKADGKQSLGGSGEMIKFSLSPEQFLVGGLRIHASRYGQAQPPQESFLIYFLSPDEKRILYTEMAPYSLFARGPEQWVEVKFERPIHLRGKNEVWVVIDFRAHQSKGAYVSYDKSTGGKHSRVGLPGMPSAATRFGGDWLIELILVPPQSSI